MLVTELMLAHNSPFWYPLIWYPLFTKITQPGGVQNANDFA